MINNNIPLYFFITKENVYQNVVTVSAKDGETKFCKLRKSSLAA